MGEGTVPASTLWMKSSKREDHIVQKVGLEVSWNRQAFVAKKLPLKLGHPTAYTQQREPHDYPQCVDLLLEPEAWKLCKPCFVTPVQGLSFDQVLLTAASGKRVARREEPIRDFCAGALVTWPVSWTKRWGLEGSAGLRCCRK